MMKLLAVVITSVLILISCTEAKKEKEDVETKTKSELIIVKSTTKIIEPEEAKGQPIILSETVEPFIEKVLKENKRRHELETQNNGIEHLDIFEKNGLQEIIAYSDKRYPKRIEPNYYEHFILFVLRYEDIQRAKNSYDAIKKIPEFYKEKYENLGEEEKQQIQRIEITIKPGGMICQKGKYVFSLVETCRETPIGGKWEEYENLFLSFITEPEEEIMILNADCGKMKYYIEERRKPAHDNR